MTEAEKYLKNDKIGSSLYGELDQEDITEFTQIMQGYADQKLLIHGVSVSLPSAEQAESFLRECGLYPHTNQSLKVLTEDSEGAYLDKKDIANLIECLTVYISNER